MDDLLVSREQSIDFLYPLDINSNLPSAARCGILNAVKIGIETEKASEPK